MTAMLRVSAGATTPLGSAVQSSMRSCQLVTMLPTIGLRPNLHSNAQVGSAGDNDAQTGQLGMKSSELRMSNTCTRSGCSRQAIEAVNDGMTGFHLKRATT